MFLHRCPHCLSAFTSPSSKSKFCSRPCHSAARRVGYIYKGYWRIRVNGKQVYQHRFVMEEALGRSLTKYEVVHHKNGDRLDNAIENLVLLASQSDHMQEHRQTYSSALHRQCSKCRIIKSFDDFYLRNDRPDCLHSHSRECQRKTPNGVHTHRFRSDTHKQCCRCEEIKPRTEFHRRNDPSRDPSATQCKHCLVTSKEMLGKC